MKRFLIIASMICLLVSSLVVVSFADEVDESEKYNYDRFISISFVNIDSATPESVNISLNMNAEAFCVIRSGSFVESWKFDSVIITTNEGSGSNKSVNYKFYPDGETDYLYNLQILFDANDNFQTWAIRKRSGDSLIQSSDNFTLDIYYTGEMTYVDVISDNLVIDSGAIENTGSPLYLISLLFTGFGTAIGGLALGIKESLSNVIWVDPSAADRTLSPLVTFIFTIAGLGIGMTVFYMVFRLIRFGRQR